jgi:hypothetical protein
MKKCFVCKLDKPVSDFDTNVCRADGFQTSCRDCNSVRHKEWYEQNKDEVRRKAKEWGEQQHKILTKFLFEYFKINPCVDCGNSNILVLECDHVQGIKVDAIGHMLRDRVSLGVLKAELMKCEVRCRNCHAIKTQMSNPRSWRREVYALDAEANEATVCKTV